MYVSSHSLPTLTLHRSRPGAAIAWQEALSSRNSLLETFLAQQQEKEQTTPKRATNGEAGPPVGQVSLASGARASRFTSLGA